MHKLPLMVCPHDTAKQPERWYEFAVYLSHALDGVVSFTQSVDFQDFHGQMHQSALIYANPQDAIKLAEKHNFVPIARSNSLYDEVVFIANSNIENPNLSKIDGQKVASVLSMLVTHIGLKHLQGLQVAPADMVDEKSWLHVLKSVYKNDVSFGFLYKDFYDGLNALSKSSISVIGKTESKQAYHMLMLHPDYSHIAASLSTHLLAMHETERGRALLESLHMGQWVKTEPDTIGALKALIQM